MQHLLTEAEMTALVPRTNYEALEGALAWCFQRLQPKHCPHLVTPRGNVTAYCNDGDGCPLESRTIRDTDDLPPNTISRMICKLERSYGK